MPKAANVTNAMGTWKKNSFQERGALKPVRPTKDGASTNENQTRSAPPPAADARRSRSVRFSLVVIPPEAGRT